MWHAMKVNSVAVTPAFGTVELTNHYYWIGHRQQLEVA
jgi:hypothetical protein